MSENQELSSPQLPDDRDKTTHPSAALQPTGAQTEPDAADAAAPRASSRELTLIPARPRAERANQPRARRSAALFGSRFAIAAAAALAIVVAVAGALIYEHREQTNMLAARVRETKSLAQAVESLKVRLDAIDTAGSRDDLADLRRSLGEIKSTVVSAREFNGAVAQLAQRVDKLDHEESAKVDKLGERVDRETAELTNELAPRIDKLEKKVAAPVSSPAQPAPAKQLSAPPKFNADVSMETTGSIERPRPLLRGYIVLDARDDIALVGGRYGEREVRQGDFLPGAGRVERIERKGGNWIVLTSEGLIPSAEFSPY